MKETAREKTKHETINNKTNFNKLNTSTMKKSIYIGIIALATMLMTSCSNDEVYQSLPQDDAIEFGTYLGRDVQSRAAELTTPTLTNFGVFASYTNEANWTNTIPNFMFNQQVSRTDASSPWGYSPKKYWPTNQGDKISFWAYAPYATGTNGITVTSDASATTTPTIQYSLTGTLTNQADFVTDVEMNVTKSADTDPDGTSRTVNFGLRHELTRVGITAQLNDAIATETKVNITKVEFGGTNFATVATYKFGNVSNQRGTWEATTTGTKLDVTSIMNTAAASGLGLYTENGVILTNTTPVPLFGANNYLFLIPFANGITTENITITVYYDIVTKDDALTGNGGYSKTSATKVITLPGSANLLMQGKAYNFNLTFYMNEIVLTATVEETWGADADNDQNVDWNDVDA